MKVIVLLSSSSIPLVSILPFDNVPLKLLIGFLGVLITALESLIGLNKYNENWIRYRSICETLKQEKYMYLNRAGVYSEENNNFPFFVERIETIISQENINWASLNKEKKNK